jgi:hypothetical protein
MDPDQHLDDQALILKAATQGIHRARMDYPVAEHGKQQDAIWVSNEDAAFYAHAAIAAIKAAGFKIVRRD